MSEERDSLDMLEEMMRLGVEDSRKLMDIEGDWDAILFVVGPEKKVAMVPLQHLLTDDRAKDFVGEELIPKVIREVQGEAIGMIMSAWMVSVDAPTEDVKKGEVIDMLVPPSQHPNRQEILMIMLADQEKQRCVSAEIKRPEGAEHPELSEWKVSEADEFGGRFWDEPIKALREER